MNTVIPRIIKVKDSSRCIQGFIRALTNWKAQRSIWTWGRGREASLRLGLCIEWRVSGAVDISRWRWMLLPIGNHVYINTVDKNIQWWDIRSNKDR